MLRSLNPHTTDVSGWEGGKDWPNGGANRRYSPLKINRVSSITSQSMHWDGDRAITKRDSRHDVALYSPPPPIISTNTEQYGKGNLATWAILMHMVGEQAQLHSFLIPAPDLVTDQLHSPAALPPGKQLPASTEHEAGWPQSVCMFSCTGHLLSLPVIKTRFFGLPPRQLVHIPTTTPHSIATVFMECTWYSSRTSAAKSLTNSQGTGEASHAVCNHKHWNSPLVLATPLQIHFWARPQNTCEKQLPTSSRPSASSHGMNRLPTDGYSQNFKPVIFPVIYRSNSPFTVLGQKHQVFYINTYIHLCNWALQWSILFNSTSCCRQNS